MILWDDRGESGEDDRFQAAISRARVGLVEIPDSFRDQNINIKPMPVIPRNAALKLTFDRPTGLDTDFFFANPMAIQLLRFKDDPNTTSPLVAFEPWPARVVSDGGNAVIVDTTLIGAETRSGRASTGLSPSLDNQTANYRIAIPSDGVIFKNFSVKPDAVPDLNGKDSRGDNAVIRDFRSGNASDGKVGALSDIELPTIVAKITMGVIKIDAVNRILTLNKRDHLVAIRGRSPFVDGGLNKGTQLPGGPNEVPTIDTNGNSMPLPAGDFLVQSVVSPTGETVRIRAEIIHVLEVGTVIGDANFAGLGLTASGTDGGELPIVRVRVASLTAEDSTGNVVSLQASDLPLGEDLNMYVRYYEHVRYSTSAGQGEVSDSERRAEFMVFDPAPPLLDPSGQPIPVAVRRTFVHPDADVAVRFSEPMDLARINSADNYLITVEEVDVGVLQDVLAEPKSAGLTIVPTRLVDQQGDGTLLKLAAPMGLFHEAN